jgi:protein-disulfide isomerase
MKEEGSSANIIVISILIGVVLLVGAILAFSGKETVTLPLKFEEFTDFQCPACQSYHPVVQKILSEFSDNVLDYKYKNFPLTELHVNAYNAALAGQAARLQGKFNEMSDILNTNLAKRAEVKQGNGLLSDIKMTDNEFFTYALEIPGLDIEKFKQDYASTEVKAYVDADIQDGKTRNINATPTFYINGKKVVFPQDSNPEDVLRATLNEQIALGEKQLSSK